MLTFSDPEAFVALASIFYSTSSKVRHVTVELTAWSVHTVAKTMFFFFLIEEQ